MTSSITFVPKRPSKVFSQARQAISLSPLSENAAEAVKLLFTGAHDGKLLVAGGQNGIVQVSSSTS